METGGSSGKQRALLLGVNLGVGGVRFHDAGRDILLDSSSTVAAPCLNPKPSTLNILRSTEPHTQGCSCDVFCFAASKSRELQPIQFIQT